MTCSHDVYRSFYTHSPPIVRYMLRMADIRPGHRVLEPCAGDGAFLTALLDRQPEISIDACEIDPAAFSQLQQDFAQHPNVRLACEDALTGAWLDSRADEIGLYQRIIANPPYGAWQDFDRRAELKKRYPGLYVKETYALFLYRCLQLLAPGGVLVFITPDTYLNLHRHTRLRAHLLAHTRIREIALFPSSFFPGVNFGYSRLSIITLEKLGPETGTYASSTLPDHTLTVLTGFRSPDELEHPPVHVQRYIFRHSDIFHNMDHALFVSPDPALTGLINTASTRIGDVADCVTGFYSGDDRRFLRVLSDSVRPGTPYARVDPAAVCRDFHKQPDLLNGLAGPRHFIPILKGGNTGYYKPDQWFIDWSREAVGHYRADARARFQNPDYYFRTGLGIPMVRSSRLSAALTQNRIFDQSIVGVFPHRPEWLYYLLAFFNAPIATRLIATINPTANNSANYIKKLPFLPPPPDCLPEIDRLVQCILDDLHATAACREQDRHDLNALIEDIYR